MCLNCCEDKVSYCTIKSSVRVDPPIYALSLHKHIESTQLELELMFMKHNAPNRCLYIKVAKLRTGVGSAEMSHLQNCGLKIYLKRALGRGGVGLGGGGQDGTERRIKIFVKIQKKNYFFFFFFGGGGSCWGGGGGVREDVNREVKFL